MILSVTFDKTEFPRQGQGIQGQARPCRRARPNFDFAEALFQIAIVLESVSIVAASRSLVKLSGVLAAVGTLLMLTGIFCSYICRSSDESGSLAASNAFPQ